MRTHNQIEASRRNGAPSKGPVTAAGQARAALNATTLGLRAQSVVLANESEERFHRLREQLIDRHQPADEEEFECVHEMATAQWRQIRMQSYEVAMLDYQRDADAPVVAQIHEQIDQTTANMLAFRAIHDADRALAFVHRYENSYRRTYRRALDELRHLQAGREKQKHAIEPNTPPTEEAPSSLAEEPSFNAMEHPSASSPA